MAPPGKAVSRCDGSCPLPPAPLELNSRAGKGHGRFPITLHPDGGGERNRTDDLLLAKQALSQLSYTPVSEVRRFRGQTAGIRDRSLSDT